MNVLRRAAALIEHGPIEGEFDKLKLLDDAHFQSARERHLARRRMPSQADNAGVAFVIALFGAPTCFVLGLIKGDTALFIGAAFWLVVGGTLFSYLAFAAQYWREHYAIIHEEVRRHGQASFG